MVEIISTIFFLRLIKFIPFALFVVDGEKYEQEEVVGNHTAPGGNEAHIEKMNGDKGAPVSYKPHTQYVELETCNGITYTLDNTLDYDSSTINRF